MTLRPFDAIEKLLRGVAELGAASGPAAFAQRCQALDHLEWHVAELVGECADGMNEPAVTLRDEAFALCARLEQMNAAVINDFRNNIATGRCLRGDLLDALAPYSDCAANDTIGYDCLDVLVAGIFGVDHLPEDDSTTIDAQMIRYQPTPARIVLELVRRTDPQPADVFVDVGSGLGVVPMLVALLSGATSIGIEVQAAYCDHARMCAQRLNVRNVRFICADARNADFSAGTLFYLFTPFRGEMLQQVLRRLRAQTQQRRIRVCTYGPLLSDAVRPLWKPLDVAEEFSASPLGIFETRSDA